MMHKHMVGIYEKALSDDPDLYHLFTVFQKTNFDYLEIAIDESEDRLSRLEIDKDERHRLNAYMVKHGVHIHSIVLSANRTYPLGSSNLEVQRRGQNIVHSAIELAADLRIPVIQIAGYYVFEGKRDGKERDRFMASLEQIVDHAASKGVMLGIENMDGEDVLSIADAKRILTDIRSPWLQLYPDVGNLVANGLALDQELADIAHCTVAVHLKDTLPNEYRRIPFGEGDVNFALAARKLREQGYRGCYTIEMWNDGSRNAVHIVEEAYRYLKNEMNL